MAKLVGAFAASHAPLMARAWDAVGPERVASISKTFEELSRRYHEARPDVLVADHVAMLQHPVGQMVAHLQLHRSCAQQSLAAELAAVEQHLGITGVVPGG